MVRCRFALVLAIAIVGLVCSRADAGKVKVWHHHAQAHFEKAQLKQAVVNSEGVLRLSRQLKPLGKLAVSHVWDVIEDNEGNLYAATGGEDGQVYKITPDGKATAVYSAERSQVFSLALAADGSVYAGVGPAGQIIRIDPRGQSKVHCAISENYIWSLAVDPKSQALYAGTGPHGRIYRVTPDGKATVYHATKQEHVLTVALAPDGTLYAGTDKGGLVYRFDAKGKPFVLFQAAQAEVRSIKLAGDVIYVATSAPSRKRSAGSSSASSGSGPDLAIRTSEFDSDKAESSAPPKKPAAVGTRPVAAQRGEVARASAAPAPTVPSTGENSVYRVAADGSVREVFREKALILSLLRQDGKLLVGTGMDGQLFEINEATREYAEAVRLDHGQILVLCRRKDGSIVLGTGDPGKLYLLENRFAAKGTIVSDVLDAKLLSKWGAVRWEADTPEGTSVTLAVRSGNVSIPDDTWSEWSAEQTDGTKATFEAPSARFLQYRVTLATTNSAATPSLRDLTLRYMTANQAPEVTKIEVPDLNAVNLDNPKKLKIKWSATDPNEDELTYSVHVKKDGWTEWVEVEDDHDKTDFEWDTTTTPSGTYRVKVVASDRKDNSDADALSAERISSPFVVSHEPPTVTAKIVRINADQAVVEASCTSPLVRLVSASFAVDGKKWTSVFPTDGLFDSKSEQFQFKTEGLKPGTHVLVLKVRDAAGNTGSRDVVFRVPGK